MADDKQIELVIRAKNLTDEAFKKVTAAIRDVESTSARTTEKGTTDWKKWFATIGGGVATGNLLSDAFKKVGHELVDLPNKLITLGERGADVRDVRSAFEGLTTSVGQTSEAMLGTLRSAFGGTIADFDLMKSANEGLSKGVKFTADDMGVLGRAARVMADRVGGDAKQSFESLISGIADGRERTLKQLPLNFANIEAAVESYARSIRKEVSELTEAQKQEGLRQAVLKESQRILVESGAIENDFGDQVKAAAVEVQNWKDRLGESISNYGPVLAGMGGIIQAAPGVKGAFIGMAAGARTLSAALFGPAGLILGLSLAAVAFTEFKVSQINDDVVALGEASKILGRAVTDIKEAHDVVAAFNAGKQGALLPDATLLMAEAYQKGAASAGKLKGAVTSLTLEGYAPQLATLKELAAAKREQEAIDKRIFAGMRAFADREDEREAAGRKMTLALQDQIVAQRHQLEVFPPLIADYAYLAKAVEDARTPLERMDDALKAAAIVMGGEFASAHQKAASMIDKARVALEREDAELQKHMRFGSQLASSIISGAQSGHIGESVGGFLGGSIGEKLGPALAKKIGGTFGETLGGMLGPLGAIGGQLLGGLVDKIFGHQGRDLVKQFADSFGGFPELQKKLQATFDPATANRYWVALTQGVGRNNPQQAKQIIDAVTAAIERQDAALHKTPSTFANASAAAEALGLDINKIGDGINSLRVHDSAEDIAAQWQVLADAGANMNEVAAGAHEKFQKLVDEALIWGHELPESMREPLQKMLEMGLLTDKSGDKLEDLTAIKWAEPLEKSVDRVIDKIDELIDRISDGLGGAIRNIPGVNLGVSGSANGGEPEHATGAYIRRDHVARVHAGEIVGPMDFITRALTGALSEVRGAVGGGGTVILQLGTRELARILMPEIANEVKTLRLGIG